MKEKTGKRGRRLGVAGRKVLEREERRRKDEQEKRQLARRKGTGDRMMEDVMVREEAAGREGETRGD